MWVNDISISGRVVRDAKRNSERGPWRFCLSQSGGKKRDGSYYETAYFDCLTWHHSGAEVKGGRELLVRGQLRHERWTDDQGGPHAKFCVNCSEITPADHGLTQLIKKVKSQNQTEPPITPKYPIPQRPPREHKVAEARPVTAIDPITDDDLGGI